MAASQLSHRCRRRPVLVVMRMLAVYKVGPAACPVLRLWTKALLVSRHNSFFSVDCHRAGLLAPISFTIPFLVHLEVSLSWFPQYTPTISLARRIRYDTFWELWKRRQGKSCIPFVMFCLSVSACSPSCIASSLGFWVLGLPPFLCLCFLCGVQRASIVNLVL